MKTSFLTLLIALVLFGFSSCSSDQSAKNISSSLSDSTKETRSPQGAKNFGTKFSSVDETYIVLSPDGSFEASFEYENRIKGSWSKEDEGKTLKLSTEKSGDGKGKSYIKTFTVIEHSDEVLKLVDSKGKNIEMTAE
jgi:hypothetical protein